MAGAVRPPAGVLADRRLSPRSRVMNGLARHLASDAACATASGWQRLHTARSWLAAAREGDHPRQACFAPYAREAPEWRALATARLLPSVSRSMRRSRYQPRVKNGASALPQGVASNHKPSATAGSDGKSGKPFGSLIPDLIQRDNAARHEPEAVANNPAAVDAGSPISIGHSRGVSARGRSARELRSIAGPPGRRRSVRAPRQPHADRRLTSAARPIVIAAASRHSRGIDGRPAHTLVRIAEGRWAVARRAPSMREGRRRCPCRSGR